MACPVGLVGFQLTFTGQANSFSKKPQKMTQYDSILTPF